MYEYNCKVLRVVDGDTIDCEIDLGFSIRVNKRVRLLGIDTCEMNSTDINERARAKEAKQFVLDSVSKVTRIKTLLDRSDSFGRVLGIVYFEDDTTLNEHLLKSGLAKVYNR